MENIEITLNTILQLFGAIAVLGGGITQSYSGGTLTITAGSVSTTTPGQFYGATNFGYELVYIY